MPVFWNKTITVFNKYEDTQTGLITWYKHVLINCFWKESNNEVNVGNVKLASNGHIIRIPQNSLYVSPTIWTTLSAEEKAEKFTLQPGDILYKGETNFVIDEMTAGQRSSDFLAENEYNICTIKAVNENVDLPNGHYYVRGD